MIQPEDLCRHFIKRIFIKHSRFISSLFTFSPAIPLFIGFSGGEEFSLSLHPLFTHSSPLFTHIEIHYTQYGKKKRGKSMAIWENLFARISEF